MKIINYIKKFFINDRKYYRLQALLTTVMLALYIIVYYNGGKPTWTDVFVGWGYLLFTEIVLGVKSGR